MRGVFAEGDGAAGSLRLFDAISLQVRHLVQAPHWSMYKETSAGLLAPKATAGFMNCAWFVRKQWVHRYNFFMGSAHVLESAFCFSRRLISSSTSLSSISPRNFLRRTCGPVGGPRVNNSRGKRRSSHTLSGYLARDSMTYPETWASSVGCSASSLVTRSTKAAISVWP